MFFTQGKVLRVSGKIDFIDDIAIRKRFYEERDLLKEIGVKGSEDPFLVVFALRKGEAFFWTFADNLKEADLPRIKFGQ